MCSCMITNEENTFSTSPQAIPEGIDSLLLTLNINEKDKDTNSHFASIHLSLPIEKNQEGNYRFHKDISERTGFSELKISQIKEWINPQYGLKYIGVASSIYYHYENRQITAEVISHFFYPDESNIYEELYNDKDSIPKGLHRGLSSKANGLSIDCSVEFCPNNEIKLSTNIYNLAKNDSLNCSTKIKEGEAFTPNILEDYIPNKDWNITCSYKIHSNNNIPNK